MYGEDLLDQCINVTFLSVQFRQYSYFIVKILKQLSLQYDPTERDYHSSSHYHGNKNDDLNTRQF